MVFCFYELPEAKRGAQLKRNQLQRFSAWQLSVENELHEVKTHTVFDTVWAFLLQFMKFRVAVFECTVEFKSERAGQFMSIFKMILKVFWLVGI